MARDSNSTLIARVLVALVEGGSRITLAERTPSLSVLAPPTAVRALSRALNSLISTDAAIDLMLQQLVTISEAAWQSKSSEADILVRIERGELGGLCVGGTWFISRDRVRSLEVLAASETWFRDHGYES
jgi:hypothetical protein